MNRKWLFWIPVLLWMGLIFYSSAQPYKKQDMRSDIEQYVNVEFVKEHFSWVSIDYGGGTPVSIANKGVGGFIEFFLRKGAHFMVFFMLGSLTYYAFHRSGYSRKGASYTLFYSLRDMQHLMKFINGLREIVHRCGKIHYWIRAAD